MTLPAPPAGRRTSPSLPRAGYPRAPASDGFDWKDPGGWWGRTLLARPRVPGNPTERVRWWSKSAPSPRWQSPPQGVNLPGSCARQAGGTRKGAVRAGLESGYNVFRWFALWNDSGRRNPGGPL